MEMTIFFTVIAAIALIYYVVTGLEICHWLTKRSFKINYMFIRFYLPLYVNQYKKVTLAETGKAGVLYYHWIISINIALVFTTAAVIAGFV